MKEKGQKLKVCAKKARAANKRRVAFLAKIATRWIYFIHIFRQLLVPNLSKSEQKNSVLALGAYYTDYNEINDFDLNVVHKLFVFGGVFCIISFHHQQKQQLFQFLTWYSSVYWTK